TCMACRGSGVRVPVAPPQSPDKASMTKPSARSRRLVSVQRLLRPVPLGLALILVACSAAPGATSSAAPSSAPVSDVSPGPTVGPSGKPGLAGDYSGVFSMDDI